MPVSVTFNTAGAWGAGVGILSAAQVDTNFYNLKVAVEELQDDRPQPNNIASIVANAAGTAWTVFLDDGTQLGPLPVPILQFRDRGAYAAGLVLAGLDVFSVEGQGIYSVVIPHTAAATFDETAADTPIAANTLIAGGQYKISTVGTTDFTLIGADNNSVGTVFIATGAGIGSGTAAPLLYHKIIGALLSDGGVTTETTTARTLSLSDAEKYIRTMNGAAVSITIPPNADVAFAVSTTVAIEQAGGGAVTFVAGAGVVINTAGTHSPTTNGQYAVMQAKKVDTNEWTVFGNLEPV